MTNASNIWLSLMQSGTAAARPTTPSVVGICFYFATDTSALSLWTGSAWVALGNGGLSSIVRNANLAATGSTVTDAAQLLTGFTVVTGANAAKGVKLPATPVAGTAVYVVNGAAAILKVWPDPAATINAIGSNSDLAMAANTTALYIADSATQWYSFPLLPS